MNQDEIKRRLSHALNDLSSVDFLIAREMTMIVGGISIFYAIYSIGYANGWEAYFLLRNSIPLLHAPWPHTINALHVIIAIAFLVSSRSLRSRTVSGFLLSTMAMLTVAMCYLWWRHHSTQTLLSLGVSDFSQADFGRPFNHAGGLREANWWDMVVLGLTGTLLMWKSVLLLKALRA